MTPPAFVMSMCSTTPASKPSPEASTSSTRVPKPASKPRKRVRASELTRKYRSQQDAVDEALLIGDKTSNSKPSPSSPHFISPPVCFSRFPASWPEAVEQVGTAVLHAALEGHDRIRVDVKRPELISGSMPIPVDRGVIHDHSRHACRVALLVQTACNTIQQLVKLDPKDSCGLSTKLTRAAIHFNSPEDADIGRRFIVPEVKDFTDVYILGEKRKDRPKSDMVIVIAPTNTQGNPEHIEKVELVHYANWSMPRIIVMLNPDLVALTNFTRFGDETREPGFLTDYMRSYYLDPAAFPAKTATGAVLRCFPRKWEMYLLKLKSDMGFRLVAEQQAPPSPEKIRCEFSWRIDPELGRAVSF